MDSHSWVLWVGVFAAVLHVLEEHAEGWVAWANEKLGPRFGVTFTETDFMLTNTAMVFMALAGAAIGWWAPAVSLSIPALFIINAVFFHMLPSARDERLTPGTISAVVIYLPVAAWMFWAAGTDGVLSFGTVLLAFVLGAALMAYPILALLARERIGWEAQSAARAADAEAVATATSGPGTETPETHFEETPPEQVAEQVADAETAAEAGDQADEGGATAVLINDGPDMESEDTAIDLAEDAATEAPTTEVEEELDPATETFPAEDETTEMRRD